MKFSVLIPVYNTEKYLEECLQSILNQTYQDFEIIIVDDGSTDSSGTICDNYQNAHPEKIKVIHKENQGLISARRVGIANATGDYCIFVDSDDFIKLNLLETIYCTLIEDSCVDLLIYSFVYYTDGEPVKEFQRIKDDNYIWTKDNKKDIYEKLLFSTEVTPIWIKAVRTSLLQSDPTDYSVYYNQNMGEDFLQSLYLFTYAHTIKYIYKPLYCYRYNEASISRNYLLTAIKKMNMIHVYRKILEYLPLWNMSNNECICKINARWFNDTMYIFVNTYKGAKKHKERENILSFDWESMLPCKDVNSYSKYVNANYLKLYRWLINGNKIYISIYIFRHKMINKLKTFKRKIKNKAM